MAKLADATRADRRNRILDAAKRCFVRRGFHAASMQEICAAAGMSAGNLYRYFPSKDALIEGLCARDMDDAAKGFAQVRGTSDKLGALEQLMTFHLCRRPREDYALWIETLAESGRNAAIAKVARGIHDFVVASVAEILRAAAGPGSKADTQRLALFLAAAFDGLVMQIVRVPSYDPAPDIALIMRLLRADLAAATAPAVRAKPVLRKGARPK